MSAIFPEKVLDFVGRKSTVIVISAAVSLAYWLFSFAIHGPEPLIVKAIYRYGDLQYFPLIHSLASFDFSPTYLPSVSDPGIVRFPVVALAFHSLLYAQFGIFGFVLVDLIAITTTAFLIFLILRYLRLSGPISAIGVFFVLTLAIGPDYLPIDTWLAIPKDIAQLANMRIYDFRIPRSLITHIFLYGLYLFYVRMMFQPEWLFSASGISLLRAGMLGLLMSFLIQSNFYFAAAILVLFTMALLLLMITGRVKPDKNALAPIIITIVTGLVGTVPLIIQAVAGSRDLALRMGMFPIDPAVRLEMLSHFIHVSRKPFIEVFLMFALYIAFCRVWRAKASLAVVVSLIATSPVISGALFLTLSPIGIQTYHFDDVSWKSCQFVVLILILAIVDIIYNWIVSSTRDTVRTILTGVVATAAMTLPVLAMVATAATIKLENSMRPDFFPMENPKAFRYEFLSAIAAIERALSNHRGGTPTLLTDDHHILTWWVMQTKGYVAMPDVFTVTSSQGTIERGLFRVGHLFGLSPDEFIRFLDSTSIRNSHTVNIWFLGHDLYQANRFRRMAPLDGYAKADRTNIVGTTEAFNIAIPEAEKNRLRDAYATFPSEDVFHPSVILLLKRPQPLLGHPIFGRYCVFGTNYNFDIMFDMDAINVKSAGLHKCEPVNSKYN
jgi:hypothetical protein